MTIRKWLNVKNKNYDHVIYGKNRGIKTYYKDKKIVAKSYIEIGTWMYTLTIWIRKNDHIKGYVGVAYKKVTSIMVNDLVETGEREINDKELLEWK